MTMRRGLFALALTLLAAPVAAQTPPPAQPAQAIPPEIEKLRTFVHTQDYIKQLVGIAMAGEKDISGTTCPAPKPQDRVGFMVLRPPVFKEGSDVPVAGAWKDQVRIDRCGKPVVHNVLFMAREKGLPSLGLLLPGATGAMPDLQGKVLAPAASAAMEKTKCKDSNKVIISDTRQDRVITPPKADDKGRLVAGAWQETWSFIACGKAVDLPVVFEADGKGGTAFKIETGAKAKKK